MAAGSGSTHASRKPERPPKLSVRTVRKNTPDPFASRRELLQAAVRLTRQENWKVRVSLFASPVTKKYSRPLCFGSLRKLVDIKEPDRSICFVN